MRHSRWADNAVADTLRSMPTLPDDALRLFAHVAAAERLYLARMNGEDPWPQDFWPQLSLDQAEHMALEAGDALIAFVLDRDEPALRAAVRYRNSGGTYFDTPLCQLLTHIALHGEHHRGQIARLVRAAGGEPPVTDFIAFARLDG